MRIRILTAMMCCFPFLIRAQITLTTQIPNNSILLKEQLWNMVIVNNSNDIAELKLQVDVRDIHLGQSVINATAEKIVVPKGMKVISVKDVQPVMYNYLATDFSGNYLPCGSYTISYRLLQLTTKGEIPVADEIERINVTPLSPPLLVTPLDKSNIETVYPQFTWMPPAPAQMFNPLLYDITVVAVEEGQTPKDAIEFNQPAYINTNIQTAAEKMPSSFVQLQEGKTYAWQVVAKSGTNYAIPTEIWVFTIGKDSVTKIIDQAPYIKISTANTEVTVAQQGFIKMEYNNVCGDRKATFHIYKAGQKRSEQKQNLQFDLPLTNGTNLLMYDLSKKAKLDENTVYEIAMVNSRGEEWLMRFKPVYYSKQ